MRLILAPHYDDILLSLPVRLCHAATHGSIYVAVVFSIEDDKLQAVCRQLYDQLNVTVHELGLTEARRRGVGIRECLSRWRTPQTLAQQDIEQVTSKILSVVDEFAYMELVAPCTRVHLDHALTRAAAERVTSSGRVTRLAYHADQPYASLWPDAMQIEEANVVREEGTATRCQVADILKRLDGFVSKTDIRRILANYGDDAECRVEPFWLCSLSTA